MTKQELTKCKAGTVLYNGRTEAVVTIRDGEPMIEILIPIAGMTNDARDYNERHASDSSVLRRHHRDA